MAVAMSWVGDRVEQGLLLHLAAQRVVVAESSATGDRR
jgi:hypothetical protein